MKRLLILVSLLLVIGTVVAFALYLKKRAPAVVTLDAAAHNAIDDGDVEIIIDQDEDVPDNLQDLVAQHENSYGKVLGTKDDVIKDAYLDKIILFSKEAKDSPRRIERNAVLVRYPEAEATIVISHGFMCDKYDSFFLRNLFPKKKYNVLTFDYRAHGENKDGQQCTFGRDEIYDLISAAQFLKNYQETEEKPLYVYGFSMGAATSLLAQKERPDLFAAMILDCPYDSTESIIKRSIDNLRFSVCGYDFLLPGHGLLKKYAFHPYVQSLIKVLLKSVAQIDTKNVDTCIYPLSPSIAAKEIKVPCFFIHCKNDERVPLESVKRIYGNYGGVKKLWITNGRGHYDSYFYNPEMYTKRVQRFLDLVQRQETGKHYKRKIIEDKEDYIRGGGL